jgi:DNA (cytosine-5)-methyltransferase 1/tRNA (cytosine38-C5)-methyltransferase
MRVLELYSGIGGFSSAFAKRGLVVAAVDHNHLANQVYAHNFDHPILVKNLESLDLAILDQQQADLWWMSPPCQPYTIRGSQRDLDDPRARSFVRILEAIETLTPQYIALENVPWFEGSRAHDLLLKTLERGNYNVQQRQLCPTDFGIPNLRKRYYLVAGRGRMHTIETPKSSPRALQELLDSTPKPDLEIPDTLRQRFGEKLHTVHADDPKAVSACFTSAYGNSPVYCGSYLRENDKIRYFSPEEILRILGFPNSFSLPTQLSRRQLWKLIGNSLSIEPVRLMLSAVPTPPKP